MRAVLALVLLAAVPPVAQETPTGPVLQVEFAETEAIPGQPLSLRLTVLAPTFFPDPPVWPSLEAPNLLVRLPEGSTGPTSARVGGETWSGVTRNYQISPMVPGDFTIQPQEVVVTYADPDSNAAVKATLRTEALAFRGTVPEGTEALDPFIAADALEIEQTIEGNPASMAPSDSVTRTVVATIAGTSPMFLPGLLGPVAVEGVASYPAEPALAETDDRGRLGGSRTESVILIAEGGGRGEASPISVDWYNIGTGEVETASVEGFAIAVDGPPARAAREPRDWRAIGLATLAAVVALTVVAWAIRRLLPLLRRWVVEVRARRLASEAHAYAELRRVVAARNHAELRPALDRWAERVSGADPRIEPRLANALTSLGADHYDRDAPRPDGNAWRLLAELLPFVRSKCCSADASGSQLPKLNPCTHGPGSRGMRGALDRRVAGSDPGSS